MEFEMSKEVKEDDPTPEEIDAVAAALTIESGKNMALADTLYLLTLTDDLVPAAEKATLTAQLLADIEARGQCDDWPRATRVRRCRRV